MTKILRTTFQLAILCFALTSCSSDDEGSSPVVDSTIESLSTGNWIINSASVDIFGSVQTEEYVHMANCSQDYWDFKTDGTYEQVFHEYNGTECTQTIYDGTYILNDQTITLTNIHNPTTYAFLDGITEFQLEALNSTSLIIGTDIEQQGATVHATLSFIQE